MKSSKVLLKQTLLIIICAFILCAISYTWLDKPILLATHENLHGSTFQHWLILLGDLTTSLHWMYLAGISLIIGIILLFIKKRRIKNNPFIFFPACIIINYVITFGLKYIIGRARPIEFIQNGIYGFHFFTTQYNFTSMPSGHAASAFAGFLALGTLSKNRLIFLLCLLCAIIIALSRVLIAKHYPSDILFGAMVGTLVVMWLTRTFCPLDGHK